MFMKQYQKFSFNTKQIGDFFYAKIDYSVFGGVDVPNQPHYFETQLCHFKKTLIDEAVQSKGYHWHCM